MKVFCRPIFTCLLISVILPARATTGGGDMAAGVAQSASGAASSIYMMQSMGSVEHCFEKKSSQSAPPRAPWMDCALLAVNVLSVGTSIAATLANGRAKDAVQNGPVPEFKTPDSPPIADNFNPFADASHIPKGFTPATIQTCLTNPNSLPCQSAMKSDLNNKLSEYKSELENGSMPAPEGQSSEQTLADINQSMATLNGDSTALAALSDGKNATAATEKGSAGNGSIDYDEAGAGNALGLKPRVGNNDRAGAGAIRIKNMLERSDAATDMPLSLWQIATRRMQGDKGGRAFAFARMEELRKKTRVLMSRTQFPARVPESNAEESAPLKISAPVH